MIHKPLKVNWELVIAGAILLGFVGLYNMHPPTEVSRPMNIWVFVMVMACHSKLGVLIPTVIFSVYNSALLFRLRENTYSDRILITTILAILTFAASAGYYATSWKYRGKYTAPEIYNGWLMLNITMAAATALLLLWCTRSYSSTALVVTNITLFTWFFTFAFPYIGEMI